MAKSILNVGYKLSVGSWSVESADDPRTELVTLDINHSLDSPGDYCRISVYASPAKEKSLLEEGTGAAMSALGLGGGAKKEEGFSVDIRGKKVKADDQIKVELTAGDVSGTVMTAGVQSITSSLGLTTILGRTGMQGLTNTRVNQVYQNQSLSQIVQDLAKHAAIDTGQIDGSTYSYFVVHESKNVFRHIRELAMRDGVDVYFDENNKLTIQKFDKSSADHTFYYGIDILDLQLLNYPAVAEHVFAYGESSSSSTGSDTWHWIVKDLQPVQGEVGKGAKVLGLNDGAVRTKDLAASLAASKAGALKDSATAGRLHLMGNPAVKLGEAIEIKSAPKPELNGVFKVTSVRHIYNKREGYITLVGFSGKGGAEAAGGLLGQLAGALAGAVGL